MGDTVRGDLGISQRSRRTVATELSDAIPWTLLLVGIGTLLATLLGTWLGVIAATRRGTATDDGLLGFSLFTYAAPEYWIGIILILLFAVAIPLFPAGQQVTPGEDFSARVRPRARYRDHMVLPVTTVTLMLLGQYFVIMRSSMVDVLTEDFVTVKRATGMPWNRVVRKHAVPNALLPLVTLAALQFGAVAGGLITIETIFSWPGLGELTYNAINDKDFPVLQGTFLVFSIATIAANLVADALYFVLDPRVKSSVNPEVKRLLLRTKRGLFGTACSCSSCCWRSSARRSRRTIRTRPASTCSLRRRPPTGSARQSRVRTCSRS